MSLSFCGQVFASNTNQSSVYEPILDYSFLAEASIDIVDGAVVISKDSIEIPQGRSSISSGKKETVMLVPSDGTTPNEIIENINSMLVSRSSGSKYEEDFDSTFSAKLYMTIYYDRKTENNRNYILLTQVSGGLSDFDSYTYATDQTVTYGCSGVLGSQSASQNPITSSWSYTTPSSWEYVYEDTNLSVVGAYYEVVLNRGGSTWEHGLSNNIVSNFEWWA